LRDNGVQISDIQANRFNTRARRPLRFGKQVRDEAKNAEIFVHNWETGHLFGGLNDEVQRNLMNRAGVPDRSFSEMQAL
jgi:hypothetical protein